MMVERMRIRAHALYDVYVRTGETRVLVDAIKTYRAYLQEGGTLRDKDIEPWLGLEEFA